MKRCDDCEKGRNVCVYVWKEGCEYYEPLKKNFERIPDMPNDDILKRLKGKSEEEIYEWLQSTEVD